MKKIAAFVTALVIFTVLLVSIHILAIKTLPKGNRDFGYWISSAKDSSYELLAQNIGPKTQLYMGSSEFHHGLKTQYNPSNLFRQTDLDVMCLGAAFNQCLTHAITVGAVGPKMENKKVCLILSPTWFYSHRSAQAGREFLLRYSSTCYFKAMHNDQLSEATRDAIKTRKEHLLNSSGNDDSFKKLQGAIGKEKDRAKTVLMWTVRRRHSVEVDPSVEEGGNGHNLENTENPGNVKVLDFGTLMKDAEIDTGKRHNPYNMKDKIFNRKFKGKLSKMKNKNANLSFDESDEYGDLQIFIDVCKDQGLDVELILQPMNGKWYDYTGLTADKRHVVSKKVREIADKNGVKLCDLTNEEYTEGFFEDAVHPAQKGWVIINEKAYNFFNS